MKQQSMNAHSSCCISTPTHDQIALAAYHLYVKHGSRDGHDLDDWLRAEELLKQKLKTVANVQVTGLNRETTSRTVEIHPAGAREHSLARDERGSASREEIRQKLTPRRPASRQPQWRTERTALPSRSKSLA